MNDQEYEFISGQIKERSGLVLTKDKAYLLESRLTPIARKYGKADLSGLIQFIRAKRDEGVLREVTEAMTTNESFFFRDMKPFDLFRNKVLPHLFATRANRKSFRIWCAACSSGQEPYSLAILLKEAAAQLAGWRTEIVATDISYEMLAKAKAGLYSQFEVQRGMPVALMVKYFKKVDEAWQIDPAIRAMVAFKEFNLLGNLRSLGNFDVVFCRNVLIYFDPETKGKVLGGIADMASKDAILFLGGAETVLGISDRWKPVAGQRGIYELNAPGSASEHEIFKK